MVIENISLIDGVVIGITVAGVGFIIAFLCYCFGESAGKATKEKDKPYDDEWRFNQWNDRLDGLMGETAEVKLLCFFAREGNTPYTLDEIREQTGLKKEVVLKELRYLRHLGVVRHHDGTFYANTDSPLHKSITAIYEELGPKND